MKRRIEFTFAGGDVLAIEVSGTKPEDVDWASQSIIEQAKERPYELLSFRPEHIRMFDVPASPEGETPKTIDPYLGG